MHFKRINLLKNKVTLELKDQPYQRGMIYLDEKSGNIVVSIDNAEMTSRLLVLLNEEDQNRIVELLESKNSEET